MAEPRIKVEYWPPDLDLRLHVRVEHREPPSEDAPADDSPPRARAGERAEAPSTVTEYSLNTGAYATQEERSE
jgi:hypothetical protein